MYDCSSHLPKEARIPCVFLSRPIADFSQSVQQDFCISIVVLQTRSLMRPYPVCRIHRGVPTSCSTPSSEELLDHESHHVSHWCHPGTMVKICFGLLGHMIACIHVILCVQLHIVTSGLADDNLSAKQKQPLQVPHQVVSSCLCWMDPLNVCQGVLFHPMSTQRL